MKKDFSVRKRQMINQSQRTMFLIVAGASIFVGICLVSSYYLVKNLLFNQKVIAAQNQTLDTLAKNYKNIQSIDNQVKVLTTNELLANKKAHESQAPLQVILDALPDRANTPALGESIRQIVLNVPGIEVEQLSISKTEDETGEAFSGQSSVSYNEEYNDIKEPSIYFRLKVSGTAQKLNQVLKNIENLIRPVFVDRMEFQAGSSENAQGKSVAADDQKHWLTIAARSFYSHTVNPEMKTKVIKDGK